MLIKSLRWDSKRGCLKDSLPKKLFDDMPIVHVTAVATAPALDTSRYDNVNRVFEQLTYYRFYVCPVYRLPRRTDLNYIFDVTLKTDSEMPPDNWVLRGVALLTSKV